MSQTETRKDQGRKAGIVCLVTNGGLAAAKLGIGLWSASVTIFADGINNLTDCVSALIAILGFQFAARKEDSFHPYGHGRMEYISGLLISLFIMGTGLSLGKAAVTRLFRPVDIGFSIWLILIPTASVAVKLVLAGYLKVLNRSLSSAALKAAQKDSLSDAGVTVAAILSILAGPYTRIPLDAFCGLAIAAVILGTGGGAFFENVNLLLGRGVDSETERKVEEITSGYEEFTEIRSFSIHDYGPEERLAFLELTPKAHMSFNRLWDGMRRLAEELERKTDLQVSVSLGGAPGKTQREETGKGEQFREADGVEGKLFEGHIGS